jgi:hypothetical protein
MMTNCCKLIDAAAGRRCFPWPLAPRSAWPLLMLPPLLLLGATQRADAQTMGFSVGFSTQVTRGVSVSSEVEVRSGRGFYLEGENVTPVDGSTSILAGDTDFQIRNPADPFSLVQQDLTGETIRKAETQSSTFSAGRSTNLSVFSNF